MWFWYSVAVNLHLKHDGLSRDVLRVIKASSKSRFKELFVVFK